MSQTGSLVNSTPSTIEPLRKSGHAARSRRRANRVHEAHAALVALVGGIAAAFSPASPTGNAAIDVSLVAGVVVAVVWAAASAPWWLLGLASLASVFVAGDPLLIGLASLGGVGALYIGWRKRDFPILRAVSAAATLNVLARAEIDATFGMTAAIAVTVGLLLFVAGARRRPRPIRRVTILVGVIVAGLAVVATAAFVVEAVAARSALADGKREADAAIEAVVQGDYGLAAGHFRRSSELLNEAHDRVTRPWTWPAALVPVVAQHRTTTADLTGNGGAAMAAAADALLEVNPETLRVEGGVISLAAVEALNDPVATLNDSLDNLSAHIGEADSPWLLSVVREELDELSAELDDNESRLDDLTRAVALAPQMLGRDGPRVYLVLFTTPSEARGLGGFIGNYAELTVDGGRIEMTDFGRASELEARSREIGVRVTGPAEFLSRYGTFGYNTDGNGLVGQAPWRNLSMSPDFPTVAAVAAEMYPQITGRQIDGVIAIDPYVVATLLGYTGPIQLSTVDYAIDSANAASYILIDQYQIAGDNVDRIDALEEVAQRTFEALLTGAMPGPNVLARDLGPLTTSRRLAVWTADPAEQDLLRSVGLLDEIPRLDGADGWAMTVTNAIGNKIDTFLQREFSYTASTDDGLTTATLAATLVNSAPNSGLPDYVIGNVVGQPVGTSRLYVSFYSALELQSATLNGTSVVLTSSTEAGWNVYSGFVTISSGQAMTYDLSFSGTVSDPDRVVTWTQPLVIPPVVDP